MTHEQFLEDCKKPVDIQKAREALHRFIESGNCKMSIPARVEDDDFLISRALDELERYREMGESNGETS